MKLGEMLLIKPVSDYYSRNSRLVFGQFSEKNENQQKTLGNDFEPISRKIIFRKIVCKFSVNVQ